jgi:glyoxylase-like metal-dependent hydrolase (beta-lactamase superfamily II)
MAAPPMEHRCGPRDGGVSGRPAVAGPGKRVCAAWPRCSRLSARAIAAALTFAAATALAVEVNFQPVAPGIYAHIGETGGRTYDNEGLNANLGLVVTPAGSVLIDSGWFKEQGAEIIAHANARADMQARGSDHLQALRPVLKERLDGTVPVLPTRWIEGNDVRLELGGVAFELKHRGGAHTPGDTMVWLPARGVLFTGDVVYVERLLGVIPVSNTRRWLETFAVIEQLNPKVIVPGHGKVTDPATALADTKAYLEALRAHMKKAVDDGTDISAAIRGFDAQPYMRLLNAAELHPGNASRTYLELERE